MGSTEITEISFKGTFNFSVKLRSAAATAGAGVGTGTGAPGFSPDGVPAAGSAAHELNKNRTSNDIGRKR
jgi:hypothetical protein